MSNVLDHGGHGGGGAEQGQQQQQQQGDTLLCYFHPRELLVGVCAHCLRERLLLLLASNSKQQGQGGGRARVPADGASYLSARPYCRAIRRVRTGSIVSVLALALGSSFIHRLDSSSSRHHHAHDGGSHDGNVDCKVNAGGDGADDDASIASLDDSFISIKFEDNGKATWADNKPGQGVDGRIAEKAPSATTTAVVEHARRGGATRWRKQVVGRLLQLARWKRASSSSGGKAQPAACHVKAAEQQRAKGRGRGWIRSLTRRRAAHGERAWS
uniref:Uncharacterized protein n=1 Tax=Avena sativa TaxID=4498 RepID=A0ACD5Z0H7_AVESA